MNEEDRDDTNPQREPYEKPGVSWQEEGFITANLLGVCGKASPSQTSCNASPSAS